jgi:isoamylase
MTATLLVSHGTPMLLMGDEVGRSQGGNNNAYCQDNEMNWLQLEDLDPRDAAFCDFVRQVIAVRLARPLLCEPSFVRNRPDAGGGVEAHWLRPDGEPMHDENWHDGEARTLGLLLRDERGQLLALFNSHFESVEFALAGELSKADWRLLIDTAEGIVAPEDREPLRAPFALPARALVLLETRR